MSTLSMGGQHRVSLRHKLYVGDTMLASLGLVCLAFSVALALPFVPAEGPATAVVYDLLPRHTWAFGFFVLSIPVAVSVVRPTERGRRLTVAAMTIGSLCWMVGLGAPMVLIPGGGNVLAVLAFMIPTILGILTTWLVPFDDESVWRPIRRKG